MKKNLKNYEIENIINTLNHSNSFLNNISIKLPAEFRHAVRVNIKTLTERLSIYEEETKYLIQRYVDSGYASESDDGTIKFKENYGKLAIKELNELAAVNNELEIVTVENSIIERIKNMDISMAEEDVLDFFIAEE